jgi:hypothetical protein
VARDATGAKAAGPRLGRFRRPLWRDLAFWAAVALTAVAFGVQVALAHDRSGWLAWAALAVRLVVTWAVMSALMRIRVGMDRGLVAGYAEGEQRAGGTGAEAVARAGGRLAGRAMRAYRRRG